MNKSIVSKLFLGAFLILFMGSVFAACTVTEADVNITAPLASVKWSDTEIITWEILNGADNTDCVYTVEYKKGAGEWNQIGGTTDPAAVSKSWDTSAIIDGTDYIVRVIKAGVEMDVSAAFTLDNTHPTINSIVLGADAFNIANDSNTVTFTFSEAVTGFAAGDINADNGDISEFTVTGNPLIYTAIFTADANIEDAENTIVVGTGWTDLASNAPVAGLTSDNYTIDTNAPIAPGTPTSEDILINTAEAAAGVIINVDYSGTGAVEGDILSLYITDEDTGFRQLNITLNAQNIIDGNYDFNVTTDSFGVDGDKNITAIIKDVAENVGDRSAVLELVVDTTAPVVNAGTDATKNAIYTQNATSDAGTYLWEDITEDGAGTITFDTNTEVDTDVNASADGVYILQLTTTDVAGNSASDTFTLTWDTNAPSGYTVSFDQNYINNANKDAISFTFAGAEIGTTYSYVISDGNTEHDVNNTGTIEDANGYVSGIHLSGLDDGELTLTVTLTDPATNVGTAATDTITKDVVAPIVSGLVLTTLEDGNMLFIGGNILLTITADANEYLNGTITVNGAAVTDFTDLNNGTYTAIYTVVEGHDDVAEGLIPVSVILADVAGNRNDANTTVIANTLSIDATRPTLTTTIASDNDTTTFAKIGDLITITIASSEDINNVVVTINGDATTLIAGEDDNHWSATHVMDENDTEDVVEFTIDFEDLAGNEGSQVIATTDESEVLFDMTAPTVTAGLDMFTTSSAAISRTATATDTGSGVKASTRLWTDEEDSGNVTFGSDTALTTTITVDTLGTYTIRFSVADNAGNTGYDELEFTYATMYGFEYLGQSGSGFTAEIEESWFSRNRLEQMNIWDEDLLMEDFLNSAAGPDAQRLTSTDVFTVYIYNDEDGWRTVDSTGFNNDTNGNLYDRIGTLNYMVFDLNSSTASGKSIRHI